MNRKVFAVAALSLLALAACKQQAAVMEEGSTSSAMMEATSSAMMEEGASSSAMMEETTSSSSEAAAMEGAVQVEVEGGAQ